MDNKKPVYVIGGGWAGLTCATELVRRDIPVVLLESAKQLGGRARRIAFDNGVGADDSDKIAVDNGQHLMLGAYESTLTILRTVGVSEESVFKREKLTLNMKRKGYRNVKITAGNLPAPLHIAWGLLFASGLSLTDRINALKFCLAMSRQGFAIENDESCRSLLKRYQQTNNVIKSLWEPLCLAALNTHLEQASANVFLRLLREAFTHSKNDSDMLFSSADLGATFPDPAMDYIEKNGGNIRLGQRVVDLVIEKNRLTGLRLADDTIECQHAILATPHYMTRKLLAPHNAAESLTEQLDKLNSEPITTIYLQYPENIMLETDMIGLVDTTAQWIFDRKIYGQPGLMSVVISSSGVHMDLDNNALCALIEKEIANFFPNWPAASNSMVIREKRATFHCGIDCNLHRPANRTAIEGLWIAGDYTDTRLPATLEGAVRSGRRCVQALSETIM